jgi:epoxide hydrolase 4
MSRERSPVRGWHAGYVATNGIRLHYVGAGAGPLVLLCHGFPEFWYSWRAQAAALAATFQVVALDLRGYGGSDKPTAGYDLGTLTADLAGVVRAMGHDQAVIVGHDLGGMLAWQFALDYPQMTRGVVSLNTPYVPRPPVPYTRLARISEHSHYLLAFQRPGVAEAMIADDVPGFVMRVFLGLARNRSAFPRRVLARYEALLAPRGALAPMLACYRALDESWAASAAVAARRIEVPALMLVADGDPLFPAAASERMGRDVPRLRRHVVRDCGHWTQQERPGEVTACLRRFLRAVATDA